jgi:signal transduction histidine kinase
MNGWAMVSAGAAFGATAIWAVMTRRAARRRGALSGPLHELRGALAAIQLGLFAMERRVPSGFGRDRIDALRTQAERAQVAVEDVDEVRQGRLAPPPRHELVDVGAVVRRRVAAWSRLAEARLRAVELRWAIGPAIVRADAARLGQALDNLIVNALDHGCGDVRVTGASTGTTVRIVVSDQGPGIARPLRELMQAPWQGRHGHGLAVAARAVELHGGRLTAVSGRLGSKVEMELPLAAGRAPGRPAHQQRVGTPAAQLPTAAGAGG